MSRGQTQKLLFRPKNYIILNSNNNNNLVWLKMGAWVTNFTPEGGGSRLFLEGKGFLVCTCDNAPRLSFLGPLNKSSLMKDALAE